MYSHQPKDYVCPFCILVKGGETEQNKQGDIVYEDANTLAFVAPKWWVNNQGHVLVIPKAHEENIYSISDKHLGEVYVTVKKLAIAIKKTYHCDGVSTRQHNEPAGGQDVWHFHVHVFPRYENDRLYQNHDNKRFVTPEERKMYVERLRNYFTSGK